MTAKTVQERAKLRPPPLQTASLNQPAQDGRPTSPRPQTPGQEPRAGQQRFVLTDPVAFRYLEEDASTTLVDRRADLRGYECYIVEQWTTSRMHPTFMITTYTGDPTHTVKVGVLSVPTDESTWSPRLRVYFKALNQFHAKRRETPLGILMVTNLAGFPSSLAVIPVPDGDVGKHRFDFFVNEDLKRLGCSGRVGLSLSQPAASTVVKFHQLYRTSDKNDIYKSVIELIRLCQSALTLFDKLEVDYADGLLCDVTERAINDWWVEIGSDHYNVEPHDGILGPTTVAGLLGMLMGARNRLHAMGAPVSKDPFDIETMKKAVSAFQKQQRLPRTRRLDRRTMDRLHKATQKAADKVHWTMPRAVKSTVAELSGKGGDLQDGIGRRDRAGIAEIETVDIERFVQLVYGDRCKWLWLGKPLKKHKISDGDKQVTQDAQELPQLNKGLVFRSDEHGGFTWTAGRKSTVDGSEPQKRDIEHEQYGDSGVPTPIDEGDESDKDAHPVFKRATTIKKDAKSGLSKVKGAVGFRGHKSKPSVDDPAAMSPVEHKGSKRPLLSRSPTSALSSPDSLHASSRDQSRQVSANAVADQSGRLNMALNGSVTSVKKSAEPSTESLGPDVTSQESLQSPDYATLSKTATNDAGDQQRMRNNSSTTAGTAELPSIAGSVYNGVDLNEVLPSKPEIEADASQLLRRTVSYSHYVTAELQSRDDHGYPRQLSFSLAEDSVLSWEPLHEGDYDPFASTKAQLAEQEKIANEAKKLRSIITALQTETATWTQSQLQKMLGFLEQADRDQETLDDMYLPHLQTVRELQTHSGAMLREEKERLEEGVKEIETLAAKLDYEVDALKSKVEDVSAAVKDYEKGVIRIEERVTELENEAERNSGWQCTVQ